MTNEEQLSKISEIIKQHYYHIDNGIAEEFIQPFKKIEALLGMRYIPREEKRKREVKEAILSTLSDLYNDIQTNKTKVCGIQVSTPSQETYCYDDHMKPYKSGKNTYITIHVNSVEEK